MDGFAHSLKNEEQATQLKDDLKMRLNWENLIWKKRLKSSKRLS